MDDGQSEQLILEDIIEIYERNEDRNIVISSFTTTGDPTNKQLAEDRMNSCEEFLTTRGVPAENISTEIKSYRNVLKGQVNIKLVK